MHDDLVPEEREQAYNQLLALLRSSSQKRVPIEATEQAQKTVLEPRAANVEDYEKRYQGWLREVSATTGPAA